MHKFFALGMIIFFICVNTALAKDMLTFIGENEVPPYSFKENGEIRGIDVDIIFEAAKRMNVRIDIELMPWKRMQVYVEKGLCDAGFTMLYLKERGRFCVYSRVPVHYSTYAVFVKKGREFCFKTIDDLHKKKVGSVIGYSISEEFDKAVADGKIIVHEVPHHSQNIKKLFAGRLDCLVSNYDFMLRAIKALGLSDQIVALPTPVDKSKGLYVVFSKAGVNIGDKEAFANQFSDVLEEMKNDGTFQKIYNKYLIQ